MLSEKLSEKKNYVFSQKASLLYFSIFFYLEYLVNKTNDIA